MIEGQMRLTILIVVNILVLILNFRALHALYTGISSHLNYILFAEIESFIHFSEFFGIWYHYVLYKVFINHWESVILIKIANWADLVYPVI